MKKTWFITGISSGLGKALAQTAMEKDDFVIGTFRNQAEVDAFNAANPHKGFAYLLDITNQEAATTVVTKTIQQFHSIDVLVNNAGFGFAGGIEEASMTEIRAVFEANLFGTMHLTQLFLPLFRKQKSGHIIQISSHGGFKAFAGFGIYNASKFAVEGFSEALAQELSPLGIRLTIVAPGPFRTNFADKGFKQASLIIDDYQSTVGVFKDRMKAINGHQEGDPAKAAKSIVDITRMEEPPLRLPLGKVAIASILSKIEMVQNDLLRYKELAENAIYQ